MENKKLWLIAIAIIVVVVVGGFAIFHKSSKPNYKVSSSTNNTSNQPTNPSVNNTILITKTNASIGNYLADPNDNTLYTFQGDNTGVSNCTSTCLTSWPAYQDMGATTGLPTGIGFIKRTDNGQTQYTYKGKPLYYFASDSKGLVTGNGIANFTVAKP